MSRNRAPDYIIKGLTTNSDNQSLQLGAGWVNVDGSISLVLEHSLINVPGIVFVLSPLKENTSASE